jgi:carbon storage regulator
MLVLSRRIGDSVVIGEDVVVSVLDIRGDVVRIGIDAPRHVAVRRQELLAELADSNRTAASPSQAAVTELSKLVSERGPSAGTD